MLSGTAAVAASKVLRRGPLRGSVCIGYLTISESKSLFVLKVISKYLFLHKIQMTETLSNSMSLESVLGYPNFCCAFAAALRLGCRDY